MTKINLEKGNSSYICEGYSTKPTINALELEKEDEKVYVALGVTSKKTPLQVGELYILTDGKKDIPSTPRVSASGYGAVQISSDPGSIITFNGQTKPSGSWWYYSGTEILDGYATAYQVESEEGLKSDNSIAKNIKILGRPTSPSSDGNNAFYLTNANDVSVVGYQKSTKYEIKTGYCAVNGSYSSMTIDAQGGTWSANAKKRVFNSTMHDGFDGDERYVAKYLNENTYAWFEKSGYIPSAMSRLDLLKYNYHIDTFKYENSGLKAWGNFTKVGHSDHSDYDDHDDHHDSYHSGRDW